MGMRTHFVFTASVLLTVTACDDDSTIDPICNQPITVGDCDAAFQRYAFDPTQGTCVEFLYGGCGGNMNNFETFDACAATCGGPVLTECGGTGGLTCEDNAYCDYQNDTCGAGNESGLCRLRPNSCPAVLEPVCGCDGVAYSNACNAQARGVDVAPSDTCTPRVCGGLADLPCEANEVCELPLDSCGVLDGQGICLPRPNVCNSTIDPVCTCDGQTEFSNICEANAAGVGHLRSGACEGV